MIDKVQDISNCQLSISADPKSRWALDNTRFPPSFLPIALDKSRLVDITSLTDSWRKYLDRDTNVIHDGAEYHKQYYAEAQNARYQE